MSHSVAPACRRAVAVMLVPLMFATTLAACSDSGGREEAVSTTATTAESSADAVPLDPNSEALQIPTTPDSGLGSAGVLDENIIGGAAADIDMFPWTVALVRPGNENNFCGGALVAPALVMTAAHCVTRSQAGKVNAIRSPGTIDVVLGRSRLDESGGERIGVNAVWVSQAYTPSPPDSDYALLELSDDSAQAIVRLATPADTTLWAPGKALAVAGWGCQHRSVTKDPNECTEDPGGSSLEYAIVTALPADACASQLNGFNPTTMLCERGLQGVGTSCKGDSGGPVVSLGPDNRFYLVGLVSFGDAVLQPERAVGRRPRPRCSRPDGELEPRREVAPLSRHRSRLSLGLRGDRRRQPVTAAPVRCHGTLRSPPSRRQVTRGVIGAIPFSTGVMAAPY